jgi:hypothetical protein
MNLEESLVSRILDLDLWISDWTNFMRTEYRPPNRTFDCPLLFSVSSVATKCVNLRTKLWFILAYSLPWKRVLDRCCLAMDVSVALLCLHTSGVQASCNNTYTYIRHIYRELIYIPTYTYNKYCLITEANYRFSFSVILTWNYLHICIFKSCKWECFIA